MEKSTIFKIVILVLVVLSIILGGSTITLKNPTTEKTYD